MVCDQLLKDYLINKMRPLIFSTALPPICVAWTAFLFEKLPHFATRRQHLHQISEKVRSFFSTEFYPAHCERKWHYPLYHWR
nr:hypothetical protein [Avibacterium paragallinarum]